MEDITRLKLAFKRLIVINRRRLENYRSAANQFTSTLELNTLFSNYAQRSESFNQELLQWFFVYEDKQNDVGEDDTTIPILETSTNLGFSFSNFESLEEEALRTYRTVLASSFFPFEALKAIERQLKEIESARNIFRLIRGGVARHAQVA